MTSMAGRWRRGRRERRRFALAGAAAVFVLLCGLLLILFGGETSADGSALTRKHEGLAQEALSRTNMAERSLDAENYGEARVHLQKARRSLLSLLTGSAPDDEANEN